MWTGSTGPYSISVVIAALDESKTIGQVISGIKTLGVIDQIILVDDCSTDNTREIAIREDCMVLMNKVRIGQTRSLRRGMSVANTDLVITMDADMDHIPSDIPNLLKAMDQSKAKVVIGGRSQLPRWSEKVMSKMVSHVTGISDTISGFRVISKRVLEQVEFDDDDTWGSLFLIRCARRNVKIIESPIATPPSRSNTRTGGRFMSNIKILNALRKDLLCMIGII